MIRISKFKILLFSLVISFKIWSQEGVSFSNINLYSNDSTNNFVLKIAYDNGNKIIQKITSIDYETRTSFYYENYGVALCKGSFDINSYDSTKSYFDRVLIVGIDNLDVIYWETTYPFIKSGTWYYFYENGKLEIKGNYTNNLKDGLWEYYEQNGNLFIKAWFSNGKMIKSEFLGKRYLNYGNLIDY